MKKSGMQLFRIDSLKLHVKNRDRQKIGIRTIYGPVHPNKNVEKNQTAYTP